MEPRTHSVSRIGKPEFCLFFERGLSISDQLTGFFPGVDFALFDRDAAEIERLKARGLLTQTEVDKAHDRLARHVYELLKEGGKL